MNWPWKKKKLSFAETAKFNWEADTNEELRQKLNELAKQYPTLREGEYREKLLSLFRERGLDLNAEQLDMLLLLRQKTDQMLLERKAERQEEAIVSDRPGLPRPAATEDLYAEGHDDHTEAGGAPRRHYTSGI